jgi:hypothetical protein
MSAFLVARIITLPFWGHVLPWSLSVFLWNEHHSPSMPYSHHILSHFRSKAMEPPNHWLEALKPWTEINPLF